LSYDKNSSGAAAYLALAGEYLQRHTAPAQPQPELTEHTGT
jgi:hypothetical protein